jgi:hydroxymethylbilane synthase
VRIGTRGSALALAQAGTVAEALRGELVPITTSGDRDRARGDKERWVREIDRALLAGEVDAAVHSAKDVPGELAEGLVIAATPPRADPRDALVGAASVAELPQGARVGTSSLRRRALLLAARADLEVLELRGNVDTRLAKLAAGDLDAIVLAEAGLARLGEKRGRALLLTAGFTPAAGQGTLAVCTRAGDEALVAAIDDEATHRALRAERALVVALGADCHTPVGAHFDGAALHAFVGRPDGSAWLRDALEGEDPEALGGEVAARLRAAGADEVLGR